jgi:hypothetical protein
MVVLALAAVAASWWYSSTSDPLLAALDGSERVEILALDPRLVDVATLPEGYVHFHGYLVLGRVGVDSPSDRDAIVNLVHRGVRFWGGGVALCFNPRHGLSVTKDGVTTDFVICFECSQIEVFVDGAQQEGRSTTDLFAGAVTDFYEARGLTIAPEEK